MNRDTLKRFNKNFRKYLIKHKVPLIASIAILLFACVSIYISYAFYQNVGTQNIIGGSVGEIPDIEIRVMAQERDTNGNATNKFSIYPYIPRAGYKYNAAKSYCSNGGVLVYDAGNYKATVEATGHDLCYIYFDSVASLDITLNVYTENIDTNGVGQGTFTKLETTDLPSIGYSFNKAKSSCTNGSTLAYSDKDNIFTVEASGKDTCNAYMNAMDVDIASVLYFQAKAGSTVYHKASQVPANNYYELNTSKSSCTGTSTLSIENQKVIINATSKTKCVAYLDVAVGPIIESVNSTAMPSGTVINLAFTPNNAGSIITKYFYSKDKGATYTETTSTTAQITGLNTVTDYPISVYAVDGAGKKSAILSLIATTYLYNGTFPYQTSPYTKTIDVPGYYYLQVWGAQGGLNGGSNSGFGGYSKGYVYLNKNDILYVYTGGAGTGPNTAGGFNGGGATKSNGGSGGGGTDIRINQNSLLARVIVAGGGGGLGHNNTPGGYGGGPTGGNGGNGSGTGGYGATQSSGGTNNIAGSFGLANPNTSNGGGGGGGWYGGASGIGSGTDSGGGGGSGYVYNDSTAGSYPSGCLLNKNYYLSNSVTYGGNVSFESQNNGSETGHPGNGYAKVTYVGKTLN